MEKWKIDESRYLRSLVATSNNTLACDKRVTHEEIELFSTALDKKALGYDFTIYVVELGLEKRRELLRIAGVDKLDSMILISTLHYLLVSGATMQEKMRIMSNRPF
jgi:hypothetical protein